MNRGSIQKESVAGGATAYQTEDLHREIAAGTEGDSAVSGSGATDNQEEGLRHGTTTGREKGLHHGTTTTGREEGLHHGTTTGREEDSAVSYSALGYRKRVIHNL